MLKPDVIEGFDNYKQQNGTWNIKQVWKGKFISNQILKIKALIYSSNKRFFSSS